MRVMVKYKDEAGVDVSVIMDDVVKIEPEDGKIVVTHKSGARMVTEGTPLVVGKESPAHIITLIISNPFEEG